MADEKDAFEARVGTVFRGKWTLERLLGVGGMAVVYAARHKIGRVDAVKILRPEVARSADSRARFEQEAHAVNKLGHPGAVEIRDLDTAEDGSPFIVMELLDGAPLSEIAKQSGGLDAAAVLRYADDLLDVLAAAHAVNIIHRDIKPDNLFLLRDGRLKVLDFGIARMREGSPAALHTREGATLGTLGYMPPEQITGKSNLDARADIFAVGATMFRLIANRRVHDARSESELLVKMATQPAPPLASVVPSAPKQVCTIIDRALAFNRDQRYPDARAMQAEVRAARAALAAELAAAEGPESAAMARTILADARSLPIPRAAADPAKDERTAIIVQVLGGAAFVLLMLCSVALRLGGVLRGADQAAASAPAPQVAPPAPTEFRPVFDYRTRDRPQGKGKGKNRSGDDD
jgi:serine/threonine-protein kinase